MQPDYYLVLPWHFLDEFLERERDYLDARRQLHRPAARGPDRPGRVSQLTSRSLPVSTS